MQYLDKNKSRHNTILGMVIADIFLPKMKYPVKEENLNWDEDEEFDDMFDWDEDEEFDDMFDWDDDDELIDEDEETKEEEHEQLDDYVVDSYNCSCGFMTSDTIEPKLICSICGTSVTHPHLIYIPKNEELPKRTMEDIVNDLDTTEEKVDNINQKLKDAGWGEVSPVNVVKRTNEDE